MRIVAKSILVGTLLFGGSSAYSLPWGLVGDLIIGYERQQISDVRGRQYDLNLSVMRPLLMNAWIDTYAKGSFSHEWKSFDVAIDSERERASIYRLEVGIRF